MKHRSAIDGAVRRDSGLRDEAATWLDRADRLIAACEAPSVDLPLTRTHLESLRHKRETLATKLTALEHHRRRGGDPDPGRVLAALRDLKAAWSTFVRTLERETGS